AAVIALPRELVHVLDAQPKRKPNRRRFRLEGVECLKYRWTVIPRHPRRRVREIVPVSTAYRDEARGRDVHLREKRGERRDELVVLGLVEPDQVHLVDQHHALL